MGGDEQSVCRVLVVDDEPDLRVLVRIQLEQRGYVVVAEAADGVEALEVFAVHQPDAVIIDLTMPRLGGVEVARRLRPHTNVAMVGFSAAPTTDDERELLRLGVPVVTKSAGFDVLARVLGALVHAA